MNDILIHTHDLWKSYTMGRTTVHALAGVDLTVERGAFVSIIGPSGSGKSTLLHLIGGLDRPTQGSVVVEGIALESLDENELAAYRRERVGMIFQSFNLIASMTTLENVVFPLRFNGRGRKERLEKAMRLLEQVDLADRMLHKPAELSGGQQQRAATARALVNEPELILADEPTGNLDTRSGGQVMELLSSLHRSGRTVLVVSHDPRVTHYATQIIRLLDGRIVDAEVFDQALAYASTEKIE